MGIIFLGSEALARGEISRGRLRSAYRAIYPDVYMPSVGEPSLYANTMGRLAMVQASRSDHRTGSVGTTRLTVDR